MVEALVRKCPECGKELIYKSKDKFRKANLYAKKCQSCCKKKHISDICQVCGKEFSVPGYRKGVAKYCSTKCSNSLKITEHDFVCTKCKKQKTSDDFYRTKDRHSGYVHICKECSEKGRYITPRSRERMYKGNAKLRGIPYTLTQDEFLSFWQKPCFYCRGPIKTIGLDRVNNDLGYQMDNIVPCCTTCNTMKMGKRLNEFVEHCQKVVANASIALKGRGISE
jgi:hypothetical protein